MIQCNIKQESRAVARNRVSVSCRVTHYQNKQESAKPRDIAAVLFGLKFAENIHYKFKSSQYVWSSEAWLSKLDYS